MLSKEQKIRGRNNITHCLLKRVMLCTVCVIIGLCYVKLIEIVRGDIPVQKSGKRYFTMIQESENKDLGDSMPSGRGYSRENSINKGFVNSFAEEKSAGKKENAEWNLVLVNHSHPVDEDYIAGITLTNLKNGQSIDSRCYPDLQKMMDDCRDAGYDPVISSSFRTYQRQTDIFNQQITTYMNQGMDRQTAETETAKSVAIPGTSEHELGLAVDITDMDNQQIVLGMEETPVQRWLMENSWRYGFILRYPADKTEITGIVYEPWHYRYVGYEAAKYIYENQLTLEEYMETL